MRRMSLKLILLALIVALATPLAQSAEGETAPATGQLYPVDWLEGAYVTPIDRASLMDPGIAGMVRWLDSPVPSYPWYSSDLTFSRQMAPSSTFAPYREYYYAQAIPMDGEIIRNPVKFNVTQSPPSYLYYGNGQGLAYAQYLSITAPQANDLWIRGRQNWTQYLVSPVGTTLDLVGRVPLGGTGGFFESITNGTSAQRSRIYQFHQGYNSMKYRADETGRHMLYFVVDNQPSNVIIIDVFAQAPLAQPSIYPTAAGQSEQSATSPSTSQPSAAPSSGDTPISIHYPGESAFQVYVDGALVGVGQNGIFNLSVKGGVNHVISIWDGFWMYENDIFFPAGVPKEIHVEGV